jgi:Recombination endonuclease VII
MSASGQPTGGRCGKWIPRAREYSGRRPGHGGECRTAAAMADRRERLTERRRAKTLVTPEARSRWNRAYKLKLMGLTPEGFGQMLEAQSYACAMCRTPFEKDQRICIDHDHACCRPSLPSRCCGKCVRGLLCLTCNVALGYIETYSELATAYLSRLPRSRP